jgi:ABC-type transport system involved in cytochrome bd biosynthesis fused ATPase/permease subunit
MFTLLIVVTIIGLFVTGITGIGILGIAAAAFFFVCGLPAALVAGFIHNEVSYAQDRADYREELAEIAAGELEAEREYTDDARTDRLVQAVKRKHGQTIYQDSRQVHIHGGRYDNTHGS